MTAGKRPSAPTAAGPMQRPTGRTARFLPIVIIVLAAAAAYLNSFSGIFVLDDLTAISSNRTIRTLWPPGTPLNPPQSTATVIGRPLLNLSFAVNYAMSGASTWSYHLVNLLIHLLAGLTLFGIVRRTLMSPKLNVRFGSAARPLALAAALLWTLHPLQTESVTYVVQRAESLAGLLYLLTLYSFVMALDASRPLKWHLCAVLACLAGTAVKETIATAPLMVLLYDRTFTSGSFREAWRRHRLLYAGLAFTWLPLALLVVSSHGRAGSAGIGLISSADYALTQFKAIIHYLRLSFWPHPLVIDYGFRTVHGFLEVFWQSVAVTLLAAGTVYALFRRPVLGFTGAWFLVILAPTSSVLPIASQTIAEHRMYLPLAAVVLLTSTALYSLAGKRGITLLFALSGVFGLLTIQRNNDYRSAPSLWYKTVAASPTNERAYLSLGYSLCEQGELPEAAKAFRTALRLHPNYAEAHCALGFVLSWLNRPDEAIGHCARSLQLKPGLAAAQVYWGVALLKSGRAGESVGRFEAALRSEPDNAEFQGFLGRALVADGRPAEAVDRFRAALRLDPSNVRLKNDLRAALNMTKGKQ